MHERARRCARLEKRSSCLEPKDLTQLGWTGIGQDSAIDIDRWDHAIAAVPLLDA